MPRRYAWLAFSASAVFAASLMLHLYLTSGWVFAEALRSLYEYAAFGDKRFGKAPVATAMDVLIPSFVLALSVRKLFLATPAWERIIVSALCGILTSAGHFAVFRLVGAARWWIPGDAAGISKVVVFDAFLSAALTAVILLSRDETHRGHGESAAMAHSRSEQARSDPP